MDSEERHGRRAPSAEEALLRAARLLQEVGDLIEDVLYPGVARVRPDPAYAENGLLEAFRKVTDAERAVRANIPLSARRHLAA